MDRVKWIAVMARGTSTVRAQTKDQDESLFLFGELYRNDQEKDVNLLDPMYLAEFEAIHDKGAHHLVMYSLPGRKYFHQELELNRRNIFCAEADFFREEEHVCLLC